MPIDAIFTLSSCLYPSRVHLLVEQIQPLSCLLLALILSTHSLPHIFFDERLFIVREQASSSFDNTLEGISVYYLALVRSRYFLVLMLFNHH